MSTAETVSSQARFTEAMERFQQRIDGHFGVMVRDFESGLELTWNHEDVFPTASTMKVPLLYGLYQMAEAGEIDLTSRVTLSPELRVPGSGVLQHFDEGLQPTVRDLAELMITVSDNEATDLLYRMLGGERIARTLDASGLHQTHLPHTTFQLLARIAGFDPDDTSVSYDDLLARFEEEPSTPEPGDSTGDFNGSSPADMVRLLGLIESGEGLSDESRTAIIDIMKHQNFNTIIPGRLPENRHIETAHKTGSVRGVRNDAGLVYAPGVRYAIVIMSKDLADTNEAVVQFAHISRWVWDHIADDV